MSYLSVMNSGRPPDQPDSSITPALTVTHPFLGHELGGFLQEDGVLVPHVRVVAEAEQTLLEGERHPPRPQRHVLGPHRVALLPGDVLLPGGHLAGGGGGGGGVTDAMVSLCSSWVTPQNLRGR